MNYGTVADFKTYMGDRKIPIPKTDDDVILAGLLTASEWLDNVYRSQYPGEKKGGREQVREWPRNDAYDASDDYIPNDEVPTEIEHAVYEIALRHLNGTISLSADFTPNEFKKVSVSGAVAVEYMQYENSSEVQTKMPIVGQILSGLLSNGSGYGNGLTGMTERV